jgi:2',3'-cyclic-nucleotide 2'-phosphodiesterase (5'-nucleotidase family)
MKLYFGLILTICIACHPLGRIDNYEAENLPLSDSLYINPKLENIVAPYREDLHEQMSVKIAYSESGISHSRTAIESEMGNWATDIVYSFGYEFMKQNNTDFDSINCFAIMNRGGYRSSITKGNVTIGNIYEVMPFDNEIVVVKIEPRLVKHIINYLFQQNGQPVSNAQFLLSSNSGKMYINNKLYDYSKPVCVVTSDYLAKGGDNMSFLTDNLSYTPTGILVRDAIISYCKVNEIISPPIGQERIQFVK